MLENLEGGLRTISDRNKIKNQNKHQTTPIKI